MDVFHGEQQQVSPAEPIEGVFTKGEYRFIETKLDVGDHFFIYGNGFAQSKFPDGDIVGHSRLLSALQDASHTPDRSSELSISWDEFVRRMRQAKTARSSLAVSLINRLDCETTYSLRFACLLRRAKDNTNLEEDWISSRTDQISSIFTQNCVLLAHANHVTGIYLIAK